MLFFFGQGLNSLYIHKNPIVIYYLEQAITEGFNNVNLNGISSWFQHISYCVLSN